MGRTGSSWRSFSDSSTLGWNLLCYFSFLSDLSSVYTHFDSCCRELIEARIGFAKGQVLVGSFLDSSTLAWKYCSTVHFSHIFPHYVLTLASYCSFALGPWLVDNYYHFLFFFYFFLVYTHLGHFTCKELMFQCVSFYLTSLTQESKTSLLPNLWKCFANSKLLYYELKVRRCNFAVFLSLYYFFNNFYKKQRMKLTMDLTVVPLDFCLFYAVSLLLLTMNNW